MKRFAVAAAVALLLSLAACGDSDEENTEQACDALADFEQSVASAESTIKPGATIEQLQDARDDVVDSWDSLQDDLEDVAQDRVDDLESAVDDFEKAVGDIDSDSTLSGALNSLSEEAAAVQTQRQALNDSLDCPSDSSS
jgi:hypothetical protein